MGLLRGKVLGVALVCAVSAFASHPRDWSEIDGMRYHPSVRPHNPFALLDPDREAVQEVPKAAPETPAPKSSIVKKPSKRSSHRALRKTLDGHYTKLKALKAMPRHEAIAALKQICANTTDYADVPDFQKMWARAFFDLGKILWPTETVCLQGVPHNQEACFKRAYHYVHKAGNASQEASVLYKLLRCTKEPAMVLEGVWASKSSLFADVVNLADERDTDLKALAFSGILDFWQGGHVIVDGNYLYLDECMEEAHKALENAHSLEVRATCLMSLARYVNGHYSYNAYNGGADSCVPVRLEEAALFERAAGLTQRPHKKASAHLSAVDAHITTHALAFTEVRHQELMTRLLGLEPLIPENSAELQGRHASLTERLEALRRHEIQLRGPACVVFSCVQRPPSQKSCQ